MTFRRRRFAQRRKAVGLSQEHLAEQLGVERSTVVRWERGETEPQPWIRPAVARTLGVSLEELDELLAEAHGGNHARVLIAEGEPDEACRVATEAMESTQSLGSRQVVHQLLALEPLLAAHRANSTVAAFLKSLAEALDRRRWLAQWLHGNQQGIAGASSADS